MENTPSLSGAPRRAADIPLAERLDAVADWLEAHKARDVKRIPLAGQCAFAEALVVASATSERHARSLADGVAELCHQRRFEYLRTEGYAVGQWVLVDMNDMVVNIFLEPMRALYGLEALWGKAAQMADARGGEQP